LCAKDPGSVTRSPVDGVVDRGFRGSRHSVARGPERQKKPLRGGTWSVRDAGQDERTWGVEGPNDVSVGRGSHGGGTPFISGAAPWVFRSVWDS